MNNLNNQKFIDAISMFSNGFINAKALFTHLHNTIPNINCIDCINGEKAFDAFMKQFSSPIENVYTYRIFDKSSKGYNFSETTIVLKNGCIVEVDTGYFEIYHTGIEQVKSHQLF